MVERAEDDVDAHDAERLLLLDVLVVEHPHVYENLRRLAQRLRLESHAHPAVRLVDLPVAARLDGVRVNEKPRRAPRDSRSRCTSKSYSWSNIAWSRCRVT